MYVVTIDNGGTQLELHGEVNKLLSGKVIKGVNTIDSFSFTLLPGNPGFGELRDFYSLVSVYNTARQRYEFKGRVLYTDTSMSESGLITQEVTCESYAGFLCDSQQGYRPEQNWTVKGLLQHIIDQHNRQVEDYKNVVMGEVTVTDPNDNLYVGIQRENTWDTIQKKLIEKLGGEIQLREVDGVLYLDYLILYLCNNWIERDITTLGIFTGIFFGGFAVIWLVVYLCVRSKTKRLNQLRKKAE